MATAEKRVRKNKDLINFIKNFEELPMPENIEEIKTLIDELKQKGDFAVTIGLYMYGYYIGCKKNI